MNTSQIRQLRSLVRELINEALPQLGITPRSRRVTITDNATLNTFVGNIIELLDDPTTGPHLRTGQITFELDNPPQAGNTTSEPTYLTDNTPVIEVERGVVTERTVTRALSEGARILTGPRVVLTPLAREQIRRTGVKIEKKP